MNFCINCGTKLAEGSKFCSGCGTAVETGPMKCPKCAVIIERETRFCSYCGHAFGASPVLYPDLKKPHYAPGSFVEALHEHSKSALFLVGIILFTVGSLLSHFVVFSVYSILPIMMLALPLTGLWLMFAAGKSPRLPEKALSALTVFRVDTKIVLVFACVAALFLLIAAMGMFSTANELRGNMWLQHQANSFVNGGLVFLIFSAGILVFFIDYTKTALNLIQEGRISIINNSFFSLSSSTVRRFSVLLYIIIGIAVLFNLIMIVAVGAMQNFMVMMPGYIRDAILPFMMADSAFSIFFGLVANAGLVVCIVALRRFKNSLANRNAKP